MTPREAAVRGRAAAPGRARGRRARGSAIAALAVTTLLAGCGGVPADPDGTLRRVEGGELRVGITHNPPWTDTTDPAAPAGRDVGLVQRFARSLDADIDWTVGSEAVLADALRAGDLDIAVGGFTDDTPWSDKAALTVAFGEERTDGAVKKHVLLAALGENALLSAMDAFLIEHGDEK